ncbi:MAG: PatB family C-S lyase [Anaerolineaceae bacterium]|nr:PatB family C-S lyase [Anaerolineaceae bacterium]
MQYNFDEVIPRRNTDSEKWNKYGENILPFWVADMDFQSPQPVIDALQERVSHGIFGYPSDDSLLIESICIRMEYLYQWKVNPQEILFLPGVVTGFNLLVHALTQPGEGVLIQPPVYPPFLFAPHYAKAIQQNAPLILDSKNYYSIDFDLFKKTINDKTKLFLLCNPHNPVGRVFKREELQNMAEICLQNNVFICSDEIHADIIYQGNKHIPIASLSPEIAQKTITLMAPSKTFNIAGLGFSFAIIQNPDLMETVKKARKGLVSSPNVLGLTAALAAYNYGEEWLLQLLSYLQGNWQTLNDFILTTIPNINITSIEGTYLAWLDCRNISVEKSPYEFFLNEAGVAFNDGKIFGSGGEGFIRFNFGCPRSVMLEGLERMQKALVKIGW